MLVPPKRSYYRRARKAFGRGGRNLPYSLRAARQTVGRLALDLGVDPQRARASAVFCNRRPLVVHMLVELVELCGRRQEDQVDITNRTGTVLRQNNTRDALVRTIVPSGLLLRA